MSRVFLVAIAALAALSASVYSLPQGSLSAPAPEYQYNVTIVIPGDNHDEQQGKIWVTLEGKNNGEPFQHEIQLTPHSTPLRPGNSYSYYIAAPYQVEKIESVLLSWKKKSYTNLFGSDKIHVQKVVFEPAYVTGTVRTSATKKFCSTQDPVELMTLVKYKFFVPCN